MIPRTLPADLPPDPDPSLLNRLGITAYRTLRYERGRLRAVYRDWKQTLAAWNDLAAQLKHISDERNRYYAESQKIRPLRKRLRRQTQKQEAAYRQLQAVQSKAVEAHMAENRALTTELQKVAGQRDQLAGQRDQLEIDWNRSRADVVNLIGHIEHMRTTLDRLGVQPASSEPPTYQRVTQISNLLHNLSGVRLALQTLLEHYAADNDPNLANVEACYRQALSQKIPYWDVRATIRVAAQVIRPTTYLEVGTRRGWSLAQALAEAPDVRVFVVDMWVEDYAGNQGAPEFIQQKMQAVVGGDHKPKLEFINGNSHDILPELFANKLSLNYGETPQEFDLINVDGDHTLLGAWWDLIDLFPRVAIGGAIVFDDLDYIGDEAALGGQAISIQNRPPMPDYVETLQDVWLHMQSIYPNFVFLSCMKLKFRAGIAVRLF